MIYTVHTYRNVGIQTGVFVTVAPNAEKAIHKVRLYVQKGSCENVALTDKYIAVDISYPLTLFRSEVIIIP